MTALSTLYKETIAPLNKELGVLLNNKPSLSDLIKKLEQLNE
jgi:hypothetical protein